MELALGNNEAESDVATYGVAVLVGAVPLLARTCTGPGRNGEQTCGRPTESKITEFCRAHELQHEKHGTLQPIRTRTSKSTCIGPGQDGGSCGRQLSSRPAGQDEGTCRAHSEQLKRRGFMSPIEPRLPPLAVTCNGPGPDGEELCGRPAENRETLLCSAHHRQHEKHGVLKPIRKVNTPASTCIGPGPNGTLCGLPSKNKTRNLCGSHNSQRCRGSELTPLKQVRKRGEVARCGFPGCRYNNAPGGEGYCHHHWRQLQSNQSLAPLQWKSNRGLAVLDRDEFGNKLCTSCREWKPVSDFSMQSGARDELNYLCRRCQASNRMKAKYGIDLDEYEARLAAQGGTCALCPAAPTTGRRLAIDHDHACCPGEASCGNCIRGLLCPNHNRALGLFQDDDAALILGAEYILRYKASLKAAPLLQVQDRRLSAPDLL